MVSFLKGQNRGSGEKRGEGGSVRNPNSEQGSVGLMLSVPTLPGPVSCVPVCPGSVSLRTWLAQGQVALVLARGLASTGSLQAVHLGQGWVCSVPAPPS